MKCIFVLFDIGVIFVIIGLLKHFDKNPSYCLVYAWSPLVLKEFSNSGHYDSIAVFFTMLAIFLYVKRKTMGAVSVLAVATLTKLFSIFLLPLFGAASKKKWMLFAGIVGIFYLPFFLWDQAGIWAVFEGLNTYNREWAYNGSIYAVLYAVYRYIFAEHSTNYFPVKALCGLIYLGVLFQLYRHNEKNDLRIVHHCFIAIGMLFLINPVGDPWYFCWVLPFLCLFPYRSWILLSGLLMVSYINFQPNYDIIYGHVLGVNFINWIIYLPFFVYWAIESRKYRVFTKLATREESVEK